jgi:hypothetical protein
MIEKDAMEAPRKARAAGEARGLLWFPMVPSNVRDQRRRAFGAPLARRNPWEPLALVASGVTTSAERCIA